MEPYALAGILSILSGILLLGISAGAFRSYRRKKNGALLFVLSSFLLLSLKSLLKGSRLLLVGAESAPWEAFYTLLDLSAAALLAVPFFLPPRRSP